MNSQTSLWGLLPSAEPLLKSVTQFLKDQKIPRLLCDHVCYRVATNQRYQDLQESLQSVAVLKNESLVNGRRISLFQLNFPMEFSGIQTDCLELPAPKIGSPYEEGWEHAEFVTPASLQEFMALYPNLPFETQALQKKINPEISLKISNRYRIKFHQQHILDVIAREQATESSSP